MTRISRSQCYLLWLPVITVFFAGCGGPATNTVAGTVTYDGAPIEKGEIVFLPTDGEGGVAGGPIENGKFSIESSPGSKRVEITATREEGVARDGLPNYVSYIPEKYNRQSTLTAEVKPGENAIDFDLTE